MSRRGLLVVLLALAAALRMAAWHGAMFMGNDGPDFLWQADRFLAGDPWAALSHPYHPLYGAATAALSRLTGDTLSAAIAISIASGVFIVLAVAWLAARAFPEKPACAPAAALLAAVHGRSIIETADVHSDGLCLALLLGSTVLLLVAWERGACRRRMLGAGVLAGLAYLARPEGLFLLGVAGLWLLAGLRRGRPSRGAHVAAAAIFVAGLCVPAVPYVLALHTLTGHWGLSPKPSVAASGLTTAGVTLRPPPDSPLGSPIVFRTRPRWWPGGDDASPAAGAPAETPTAHGSPASDATTAADAERALAADDAADDGGDPDAEGDLPAGAPPRESPLGKSVVVLWTTLRSDALLLVAVGLLLLWRRRRGLAVALLLLVGAWVAMGALNVRFNHYLSARHMLAPVLLLLPLGGAGIVALWGAARERRALSLLLRGVVVLILLAHAVSGIRPRHATSQPRLAALAWAAEHSGPAQRLGVHRRRDGYYAGRHVLQIELPCSNQTLLDAMRQWDAPLLVLDERRLLQHEPAWLAGGPFETRARFGEGREAVVVLAAAPPPG